MLPHEDPLIPPELQRLMRQYIEVGKPCRERAASGRNGVVVGTEPGTPDIYWLPEGEAMPLREARDVVELLEQPCPDWLAPLLHEAMQEFVYWPARYIIQLGLARGPVFWPAAIALAIVKARAFAGEPSGATRAERLLRYVQPFIAGLDPQDARDILAQTPEFRQMAVTAGAGRKRKPLRFEPFSRPSWARHRAGELPIRLAMAEPLGLLGPPQDSDEDDDGRTNEDPQDLSILRPLDAVFVGYDAWPAFFICTIGDKALVVTDDAELESVEADDISWDEDGEDPISVEEFDDILEMAWHTQSAAPFVLGAKLACAVEDHDARAFWGVYGARWLAASAGHPLAKASMLEACAAVAIAGEADSPWLDRCPDLREAFVRFQGTGSLGDLRVGSLPDLAPHWRDDYSLVAMSRRLRGDPEFLAGATDCFRFGDPPFEHGAPLMWAGPDDEPHVPWRDPPKLPAPRPPVAPAPAVEAAPAPVPPTPIPVQFSQTVLLQCEWSLASGMDVFAVARQGLYRWLAEKLGVALPDRWNEGAHEVEHKGVRLEVEASDQLVAVRFEHPDHEHGARRWRVEMVLAAGADSTPGVLSVRLLAHDAVRLPLPTTATPRFLRDLVSAPGLLLGGRPVGQTWKIATNVDRLALRDLLNAGDRDFVMVITGPEATYQLSAALAPLALHLQLLPSSVADYSRRRRPIEPGTCHVFALGQAEPRVVKLDTGELTQALWAAHADRGSLPPLATFGELRRQLRDLALLRRRRPAAPEVPAASAPNPAPTAPTPEGPSETEELLQLELEQALAEKRGLEADVDQLTAELREAKAALFAARASAVGVPTETASPERAPVPESFAGLEAWLPLLGDRLDVAPKAIKEALSLTDYQNEDVALAAIDALHAHYWPMVMHGDEQARTRWNTFLKEKRLRCGPVGTAPDSSRYGRAYEVTLGGKSYTLDMHLQGHSARDTRRCLRIYYAIDREKQRIVLGHFPTHLPCHMHYVS